MVIIVVLMMVFQQFGNRQSAQTPMDYSAFIEEVNAGKVSEVVMQGRGTLNVTTVDNRKLTVQAPNDFGLVGDLLKNKVKFRVKPDEEQGFLTSVFISWFP